MSSPGWACAAMQNAATSRGISSTGRLTAATNRSRGSTRPTVIRESGDETLDVGRAPTPVAIPEVVLLPVGARHDVPARRRAAGALELVVVVGVGHRVVEAELFPGGDITHGHEEDRSDDPAIRLARVVHVIGIVEGQGAREE